jgi:hypothetical protein
LLKRRIVSLSCFVSALASLAASRSLVETTARL